MIPSWPEVVYGSKATSVIRTISGYRALISDTNLHMKFFSSKALVPSASFKRSGIFGNIAVVFIPKFSSCSISINSASFENKNCPGIESKGCFSEIDSDTKRG